MKILHTADWHMNSTLGRQNLSGDIVAALEQIGRYLESEAVDVLIVAGDLFSERSRDEGLEEALRQIRRIFGPFVERGGAILAVAGNHDPELKFESLRQALSLSSGSGQSRLVLTANPLPPITLTDAEGQSVQFVLLPYPTSRAYLPADAVYNTLEEKNQLVQREFARKLEEAKTKLRPELPAVLISHIHIRGAESHSLYRVSESDDVVFDAGQIPTNFVYAAYGHIHKPGPVGGAAHIRYSGSPIQLDAAERFDQKGCVLFEIKNNVLEGEMRILPLEGPQIHQLICDLTEEEPETAIAKLAEGVAANDLVTYTLRYDVSHKLNIRAIKTAISERVGRIYSVREERVNETVGDSPVIFGATQNESSNRVAVRPVDVPEMVRDFLLKNLEGHSQREAVLELANGLLASGAHQNLSEKS